MATRTLTADEYDTLVAKSGVVLVDFWASWCGPCRTFAPIYERTAQKLPDAVFAKVDVDAEPDAARRNGITSIPTTLVYVDGSLHERRVGAMSEHQLTELVESALQRADAGRDDA